MAEFLSAIDYVLKNEGGYSNDPADPGGATNFGIEQREWLQGNISNINRAQAVSWYESNYWNKAAYNQVNSQQIATKLFDIHVNTGLGTAAMIAQKALGFTGPEVDGCMGPKTVAAINSADRSGFLAKVVNLLTLHYKLLEQRNPRLLVFDRGWCARAEKLPPMD